MLLVKPEAESWGAVAVENIKQSIKHKVRPQKICSPRMGRSNYTPQNRPQKIYFPRMGSKNYTLKYGPQKSCCPRMGSRNQAPQECGATKPCSPGMGSTRTMLPRNGERELSSPRIGSKSGGWQKSWIQTALDRTLDYGLHKKSKSKQRSYRLRTIEGHCLAQKQIKQRLTRIQPMKRQKYFVIKIKRVRYSSSQKRTLSIEGYKSRGLSQCKASPKKKSKKRGS